MGFKGQPVPTTVHNIGAAKVSDGNSVRVKAPANSGDIAAGNFVYLGGFLGVAMKTLADSAAGEQELILQIEAAEYETNQIDPDGDFEAGTKIYWDADQKLFTETSTPVFGGVVTSAKDAKGVIWFILSRPTA